MTTIDEPQISDAEWRVMHEIWLAEPVTSSRIHDRLREKTDWSAGTIKTLLHRLVEKGILEFQRKGNRYLYRSKFTEAQCVEQVSDQLLHTVFQGQPMPMLKYLVQTARLSGTEISSLRELLIEIQQDLPSLDSGSTIQD
jgi:predicted transcriptional regulator